MTKKSKPIFVFSNLATSLDGKIATRSRGLHPLGTPADREQMQVLRRRADAIITGAGTLRSYRKKYGVHGAATQPWNVIVSSRLEGISPSWPFFKDPSIRRVLFVDQATPVARLERFEKGCELEFLPKRKNAMADFILTALAQRGIRRLLVEGGGGLMWNFVSRDLIDEFHVTLTPWIVGGSTAPTLVDGKGFEPHQMLGLKLTQCRVAGDEIYLVYRRR